MRAYLTFFVYIIILNNYCLANEPLTFLQKTSFNRDVVFESMVKAKTWQESQHVGPVPTNWLTGTLYTGVFACYEATGEVEFLKSARDWCEAAEWKCGDERPLHADDICSAQTFLDVYSHDKDPSQIEHIKNIIDKYYFGRENIERSLMGHAIWQEDSRPFNGRNLWWWCDALYMAPPVLARLATHTGDKKYLKLLHSLYWDSKEFLYDQEEDLFYRDESYFAKKTINGKKIFWSRGNGWVVGGLIRTIDYLEDSDPMKQKYLELYKEMMLSLAKLQKDDGLWSSSINDEDWLPEPESSGSSFYTFAMVAGINRGWLEPKIYLPIVVKAWEGLLNCLREDGKLEWAQLVDGMPRKVRREDHKNYAQGAFLLAASEVYKLNLTSQKYFELMGDRRILTISEEGVWTWYNDERVVFWNEHLVAGNVNDSGRSAISIYMLPGRNHVHRLETFPLSTWQEKDDHNNPALLPLGKDSLLAVYSRHNTTNESYSRMVKENYSIMNEDSIKEEDRITYSNLFKLKNENGKIYNFFRGKGWNPNMINSSDNGVSWSESTMLFLSGDSATRPYVKYASDSFERIDMFYTDGHPRVEPKNSIYHIYYKNGNFFNSKGSFIRSIDEVKTDPLIPTDGTQIYDGSGINGRGWVHDLEMGKNGELAGVFITSPDGDEGNDLRYWYARFDPNSKKWLYYEIAYAGPHLYVPENHYAGGICVDPDNLNIVYLSSSVDPNTGEPNKTGKFQIYKGLTIDGGKNWEFEQLTFDVKRDNLRPVVPRNKPDDLGECLVWFRGDYQTFTKFNCEIVGYIENEYEK